MMRVMDSKSYRPAMRSFDREFFAREPRPTQLEHVPLRLLEIHEHHVGGPRRLATAGLELRECPALVGAVHEQDMERLGAGRAHDVEQILQVRAVLTEGIGAELARKIEPCLVETIHLSPLRRRPRAPARRNGAAARPAAPRA